LVRTVSCLDIFHPYLTKRSKIWKMLHFVNVTMSFMILLMLPYNAVIQ
jgi:hypothetical protein